MKTNRNILYSHLGLFQDCILLCLFLNNIVICLHTVRTLPMAPLWCDLGFFPSSCGNKAAANLRPTNAGIFFSIAQINLMSCKQEYYKFRTPFQFSITVYPSWERQRLHAGGAGCVCMLVAPV